MRRCGSLAVLDLSLWRIGDAGARALTAALTTGAPSLTELNLAYNDVSLTEMRVLQRVAAARDVLLDLSWNDVDLSW